MSLALDKGRVLATRIAGELAGFCERIEVAGSIRRGRPNVNDVDLVCLPKPGKLPALKLRCLERGVRVIDGEMNFIVRLATGVQLDIFIAQPKSADLFGVQKACNFGSLLLCRTGSKAHNIFLVEHAKRQIDELNPEGLVWNLYYGVFGRCPRTGQQTCLASESEEEIFAALGLEFVPPERRER